MEGKRLQVILSLFLSPLLVFEFALLMCFAFLFWVSLVLCIALFNMFLFAYFQFFFILLFIKIKKNNFFFFEKSEKYKNNVCYVYIGNCVPWTAIETKFSKLYIFCSLNEHIYAQLSKWVLWLVFVMSKLKWSLVLNTYITLFDRND